MARTRDHEVLSKHALSRTADEQESDNKAKKSDKPHKEKAAGSKGDQKEPRVVYAQLKQDTPLAGAHII